MDLKLRDLQTMRKDLSSKTIVFKDHPNLIQDIKEYFLKTYALYEQLFEMLGKE
jgi:hypothetical protein